MVIYDLCYNLAEIFMVLLFVLLAKGWTISARKISKIVYLLLILIESIENYCIFMYILVVINFFYNMETYIIIIIIY